MTAISGNSMRPGCETKPMTRKDDKQRRTGLSDGRRAHINRLLMDWYQWRETSQSGGLGFPKTFDLKHRIPSDQPCTSRVPKHLMRNDLRPIDQTMEKLKIYHPHLREALDAEYYGAKPEDYPKETFRVALLQAYCWIDGNLAT